MVQVIKSKRRKKKIIIKPFGGLANRMRVIAAFLWLKEKLAADMTVIWVANDELNAEYEDLFVLASEYAVEKDAGKYKWVKTSHQKNPLKSFVAYAINTLIGVDICLIDKDIYKGPEYILNKCKNHNVIFFNTCEEILIWDKGLAHFKLQPTLTSRLESVSSLLQPNTFGMHIRRTDHHIAKRHSPIELFYKVVEEKLKTDERVTFFLATDDPLVEENFLEKYPLNIIVYQKTFGRDSQLGVIDALIELFLLSKTQAIYGSYWSSYSKMAGRLGKVEVVNVKKKDL